MIGLGFYFYVPLVMVFLVSISGLLISAAMRTYPAKLDAVLQGLGFKLEIHGESSEAVHGEDRRPPV